MASTFFLPASSVTASSAFNTRPRSSTTQPLSAPRTTAPVPLSAQPQHHDKYIEGDAPFLTESEDLEMSFASTMSLSSAPNSPPAARAEFSASTRPHMDLSSPMAMDISPAPRRIASTLRFPVSQERAATTKGLTGSALVKELLRTFGQDVANTSHSSHNSSTSTVREVPRSNLGKLPTSASVSSNSSRSRGTLPTGWMQQPEPSAITPKSSDVNAGRNRSRTIHHVNEESTSTASVAWDNSITCDAMDIDGDVSLAHSVTAPSSPSGHAAPAFNELFFQPSSPGGNSSPDGKRTHPHAGDEHEEFPEFDPDEEIAHQQKQRLAELAASSPDKPSLFSSSPPVSPSLRPVRPGPGIGLGRPFERSITTGGQGSLFEVMAAGQPQLPKRGNAFAPRRPAIKNEAATSSTGCLPGARPGALQPSRRAFSASITSSALVMGKPVIDNLGSDDSSFCDDGSPARAYATRKAAGPPMRRLVPSQHEKPNQSSPLARAGLPGFGDNEADGKVLPCHRVREDGLMRINCDTLDALLAGQFNSRINSYKVIDCRFDYEYEGGHVPGAINLNTTQAIEEYLLGADKPLPSRSGDGAKKDILVFHCEFSVKRAPTFAKHLRSRDRALNSHSYPNIHYPEVYIMSGGFNQYFKEKPSQVEPPFSYVQMDDPVHLRARHSDLNNFRRWERTKSYTSGEKQAAAAAVASGKSHMKHGSAPAEAVASQGQPRLGGGSSALSTLDENDDSLYNHEDDLSPCPPSGAANYLRLAGKSRGTLERAASFGFAMTKR
ncbi:sulfurtransferase [Rhizoctonia solani 123E]|uniref:M-phase inducer phosphatase n=1 Tax=Rhizoctonia solani 123E TaxID=1423351 RepID=A0A074S862_9AGAM|nr:sulfurtransferase [Rhizoctonia solani 123E]